jgi:TonB-dependent SusC/RagA subfamily outer membrane receptor
MIGLYSKTEKASEIMQTTAPGQDSAMRNIIGKVVDDKGAPMAGAMVMIEGSNSGTTTDYNGMFSIKAAADQTISVSYLGFTTASVKVTTADYYEVIMNPDSEYLDDVVVTALGIKRSEKALGYSVQKVATEGLTSAKGIAISSSLTGRVAGLNVRNSTEFFDAPTLRLRGEAPTIIIDGIPYSSISLSQLSPDDIESIDVLKGATASALYGAQASTGVIMVTTKKGSEAEGLNVEVNSNTMVFSGFLAFPEVHGMYASGTNGKMNYN